MQKVIIGADNVVRLALDSSASSAQFQLLDNVGSLVSAGNLQGSGTLWTGTLTHQVTSGLSIHKSYDLRWTGTLPDGRVAVDTIRYIAADRVD